MLLSLILPVLFLGYSIAIWDNQTCSLKTEEFCGQNRMLRHEIRYPGNQYPSFCSYGDPEKFAPNKDVKVQPCGWPGLDMRSCLMAGCCYESGVCYKPIRPAEIITFYHHQWVSFDSAEALCRVGGMKLPCVRHPDDLVFLSHATCSATWLAGYVVAMETETRDSSNEVSDSLPYFNSESCETSPVRTVCQWGSSDHKANKTHALSFGSTPGEGLYHVTNASLSEKKSLLCAHEYWVPILDTFPQHQQYSGKAEWGVYVGTAGRADEGTAGEADEGSAGGADEGIAEEADVGTAGEADEGTAGRANEGTAGRADEGTAGGATFSCKGNAISENYNDDVLGVNLTWIVR